MSNLVEITGHFVASLERLRDDADQAALAKLRRGLGKPPGLSADRDGWGLSRLPENISPAVEEACCLVASLFALHPEGGGRKTLGAAFRRLQQESPGDGPERRLVALLDSDRQDLPGRFRHAVSLLKSKDIPLDWRQLLLDVLWWTHPDRLVQRRWARDFWAGRDHAQSSGKPVPSATKP